MNAEQFLRDLTHVYFETNPKRLRPKFLAEILTVFGQIFVPDKTPQEYELQLRLCVESLTNFTNRIDYLCLEQPESTSPFTVTRQLRQQILMLVKEDWKFRPGADAAYAALAAPFQKIQDEIMELDLFKGPMKPYAYTSSETFPSYPGDWYEATPMQRFNWEQKEQKFYDKQITDYADAFRDAVEALPVEGKALINTPLLTHAHLFIPNELVTEPVEIPQNFTGVWCVAPPGQGKTTLLKSLFFHHLKQVEEHKLSIVIMDSKGAFSNEIKHLRMFAPKHPLHGKLILIEPDQVAINPLDIHAGNISHTLDLIDYLFSTFSDKLTDMQSTLVRPICRAMIEYFPVATLETLRDILQNGLTPEQRDLIQDPGLANFFDRELADKKLYAETKGQVLRRLRSLYEQDTIKPWFTTPKTLFNMGDAMDSAKVIVINNAIEPDLGERGSELFSRFFVALLLGAARRRSRPEVKFKMPVEVIMDECQTVIANEEKIATIFDTCREQKINLTLAHQRVGQIVNLQVQDALANSGVIIANTRNDAHAMAPKLFTPPSMLIQPVGTFACYIPGKPTFAMQVAQPPKHLKMVPRQQALIREEMQKYACTTPVAPIAPQPVKPVINTPLPEPLPTTQPTTTTKEY